jgi:hypothetical protein
VKKLWLRNRRKNETSLKVLYETKKSCSKDCKIIVVKISKESRAIVSGVKHSAKCEGKT